MNGLWIISVVCLALTGILCVVGILSEMFDDTLWQRAGMSILAFFCFGRIVSVWDDKFISDSFFGIHLGMAMYAVATAVNSYGFHIREKMEKYRRDRGIA